VDARPDAELEVVVDLPFGQIRPPQQLAHSPANVGDALPDFALCRLVGDGQPPG
jgi:hypothetical protein